MTKERFVEYMTEFEELKKIESNISKAFQELDTDFNFISFGRYERLVTRLLEESMNDKDEWISWWIYEADFGKNVRIADSVKSSGVKIPVRTSGQLYDLLTME